MEIPEALAARVPVNLVPTNLPGVYAARPPVAAFDPRQATPAELQAQGIFVARPGPADPPAAHISWEQAFSRTWDPEDWIVPVFESRLGVRHLLEGGQKLADGTETSPNWSGGILDGTWTAAQGTWTVPAVGASALPKDISGGWNSSSWVGLDGKISISNDVLQAGVEQSVDSVGTATYTPWYEWYAPSPPADSASVAQQNITNMTVKPGDVVFTSVQYVNVNGTTTGQIMFHNITTGKVFSLTLDPPKGADAKGNCAEWIMETPSYQDKSYASLPRFTPVYFTGAQATGAKGTTGDPLQGDTCNIVRNDHAQTVSSIASDAVTVTYVGIGWYPIHPESTFDHAHQHVTARSRMAGGLDLFVIGSDNRVYSTFWTAATGWNPGGWYVLGPSHFDHTTQRIAAVSREPGSLDLFVVGFDNVVYWLPWRSASGWAADWDQLNTNVTFDDAHQHVTVVSREAGGLDLFVIGSDNRVYSTFWTAAAGWNPGGWYVLGTDFFDHTVQRVAAVSRDSGSLDLLIIGIDNLVYWLPWRSATGWVAEWDQLSSDEVFDHASQQVEAVARSAGDIDLFAIGGDDIVRSIHWMSFTSWA
jgi:hypothetical protein